MRGSVEIYYCDDQNAHLVVKEDNLIVDGAGKLIVDMLTISPSLSGISSASALLDASNFSLKAMSFGAPSGAYTKNIKDTTYPQIVSALTTSSYIVLQNSAAGDYVEYVSGYIPKFAGLPKYPDPIDTKLESTCAPSGSWGPVTSISLPYTSPGGYVVEDFGQHMNVAGIPTLYNDFGVSGPIAILLGSYAISSIATSAIIISSISQINTATVPPVVTSFAATAAVGATTTYNGRNSVDRHGFINIITPYASGTGLNFTGAAGAGSGIQLSAVTGTGATSFSSVCELVYATRLGAADARVLNLYGGIYNAGLWSLNLNESIQRGNKPPYSFTNLNNPMRYRLFCKKSFTKNVLDFSSISQATVQIVWRIKFI